MGLRTWPQRTTTDDKGNEHTYIPTNLKQHLMRDITSRINQTGLTRPQTISERRMLAAVEHGAVLKTHATTTGLTQKQRIHCLEFLWGVHHTRMMKGLPKNAPLLCGHCKTTPLTNSHMAGNCPALGEMRTARHDSTFSILETAMRNGNGGRWPIIAKDLGRHGTRDLTEPLDIIPTPLQHPPPIQNNQTSPH